MDLLQTVRKEGSRGGRGDFKWEDVKNDAHRENYLGHSLMAPIGRWQKGRDLNWYAKSDDNKEGESVVKTASEARAEEIRKIKEAEEDARAKALGLPPPVRNNPNMIPVTETKIKAQPAEDRRERKRRHKSREVSGTRKKVHTRRYRSSDRGGERRRHRSHSRPRSRSRTLSLSRLRSRSRSRSRSRPRLRDDNKEKHSRRYRSQSYDRWDHDYKRGFRDRSRSRSGERTYRRRKHNRSRSP